MCDYSLESMKSRPARKGERLFTHRFASGTTGFASPEDGTETAVCLLPGTELAFDEPVQHHWSRQDAVNSREAIFAQKDKDQPNVHHDVIQFAGGEQVMVAYLKEGQHCTVLQLPADPVEEKAEGKELEAV